MDQTHTPNRRFTHDATTTLAVLAPLFHPNRLHLNLNPTKSTRKIHFNPRESRPLHFLNHNIRAVGAISASNEHGKRRKFAVPLQRRSRVDLYCNSLDSDNFYTGQQGGEILLARPYPRFWQEVLLGDSRA